MSDSPAARSAMPRVDMYLHTYIARAGDGAVRLGHRCISHFAAQLGPAATGLSRCRKLPNYFVGSQTDTNVQLPTAVLRMRDQSVGRPGTLSNRSINQSPSSDRHPAGRAREQLETK